MEIDGDWNVIGIYRLESSKRCKRCLRFFGHMMKGCPEKHVLPLYYRQI